MEIDILIKTDSSADSVITLVHHEAWLVVLGDIYTEIAP